MIFNEIYGCYYNTVAEILKYAVEGKLDKNKMTQIINEKAFSESILQILPAINEERWQILKSDLTTPIRHCPTLPLSSLEKRWLKAISLDARIKLFDVNFDFLNDTEPLFTPDDYILYDKYNDGDPFCDKKYINIFRTVLYSIKNKKKIRIEYLSRRGNSRRLMCDPYELEYSAKDDKFRVYVSSCRFASVLNMAGIRKCEIIGDAHIPYVTEEETASEYFIMELEDVRNTLERAMLHFAHFEKEAEHIGGIRYRIKIKYSKSDETELVIRVLSFGTYVKVIEPQSFVSLIKDRLIQQKRLGIK